VVAERIDVLAWPAGRGDAVGNDVASGIGVIEHERGHGQQRPRVASAQVPGAILLTLAASGSDGIS
jgi:hypothetical protein